MRITTFFIDRFKEVSFTETPGIKEEGGVYGDETNYSSWVLGDSGDTSDFVRVVKTNVLYGDLYKITLDTGNDFNTQFVPNLNGFMNMDIQEYWDKIITGDYTFNGIRYSDYRPQNIGIVRRPGQGQTGGGTPVVVPTLLEYVMGVKERIGWVEVNRTRASIYYELCFEGKTPKSDHFYDIEKFIMTPELFDPFDETFVQSPNTLTPLRTFSYEKINPYLPDERYFTLSPNGSSSKRIGLSPIDTWFQWNNNSQGHTKIFKGFPQNEPNSVIGGFTTFPWPMGQMWGQISTDPSYYLKSLVTGNHIVLDANMNERPIQKKMTIPQGIGQTFNNVELILANKEKHLNLPIENRLISISEFGTSQPISTVYSIDIWGEKRSPNQTINIGFYSLVSSPSIGDCIPLDFLKEKSPELDLSIRDPFGLDLYQLDKKYEEIYEKFRFCPPRKKIVNGLDVYTAPVFPKLGQSIKLDFKDSNISSYYLADSTVITRIGAFDPTSDVSYIDELFNPYDIDENSIYSNKRFGTKINFKDSDVFIDSFQESAVENSQFADKYYTTPSSPLDDSINDTLTYVSASTSNRGFFDTENSSIEKIEFKNQIYQSFNNELEIENGIRNKNDFIVTNQYIPYGTYSHTFEQIEMTDGSIQNHIKIKQNGSDADVSEFKEAVSNILKTSGADKNSHKIIGVAKSGFPIFRKNTVEESINDLKEQLTGIKEIIFRGSEVLYGAVSAPIFTNLDPFSFPELPKKFEYVNTGIYVSGTIDLSTGNPLSRSSVSKKEEPKKSYGGWVFSGLWHRNGLWPKDHTFRSGLLGNLSWTPCDGGVNTGAWIKVPDQRVRIEYHDFKSYSNHTINEYIHDYWKKTKNALSGDGIGTPFDPMSEIQGSKIVYQPDDSTIDKFNQLSDWEKSLVSKKKILKDSLSKIDGSVVIIRLRDNEPDLERGLNKIITPVYGYEQLNKTAGNVFYKQNHLLEEWIVANNVVDDDTIMDRKDNYGMRWYSEPTEHTLGTFKKDEWYRAVFLRAVTSPSHPNGQIAGSNTDGTCRDRHDKKNIKGIYPANKDNINTFCDLLYVSEQILKMHRERLVEMKKYIDNKTKFVENSNSDFAKKTFSRSMRYVRGLRELFRLVK